MGLWSGPWRCPPTRPPHLAEPVLHYDFAVEWSFSTSSALEKSLTKTLSSALEWSSATSFASELSLTIPSALQLSIATTLQMNQEIGLGFKRKKKEKGCECILRSIPALSCWNTVQL